MLIQKSIRRRRKRREYYKGKRISKGEKRIAQFLDQYNIKYIREYKFFDCVTELGNPLRFDFYLPDFNLLIEYDGQHHYKAVNKYSRARRIHNLTIKRDQLKNEYAMKNKIEILRISYVDYDNIEQILLDYLNYLSSAREG